MYLQVHQVRLRNFRSTKGLGAASEFLALALQSFKSETTPGQGSRFPLASYVLNPPGTRPKPLIAPSSEAVTTPMKGEPGKQSVFRRAWADMSDSDSSEEEPAPCELPPLPPQAESSSGRRTFPELSRSTYRRLRQYAFWKVRKGYGQKRPKHPNSCGEASSDLRSVAPCHDSVSLIRLVDESAHDKGNHTGEGNRCPGNETDGMPQGHVWGESEDKAAVSRCILDAVWSRVAVQCVGSTTPSQSTLPIRARISRFPLRRQRAFARVADPLPLSL